MRAKITILSLISILLLAGQGFCQGAGPVSYSIVSDSDDGTEVNDLVWAPHGFTHGEESQPLFLDYMGENQRGRSSVGLRFVEMDDLEQGDKVEFARLRFASFGGRIDSSVPLVIRGVRRVSPETFGADQRPSQKLPKTLDQVGWVITAEEPWESGLWWVHYKGRYTIKMPLFYSSPDISGIINEILSLPGWGTGPEGKTMVLTLKQEGSIPNETNYCLFHDFHSSFNVRTPARLEICKSVYDTFVGKECLGRVTDTSATVNLYSLIPMDVGVEYGTSPGEYTRQSPLSLERPAETPIEVALTDLTPNTRYYYRILYRRAGETPMERGKERTFRTQRGRNAPFSFSITSDEHLVQMEALPRNERNLRLYKRTIENIASNPNPDFRASDFFVSLGDFVISEGYGVRDSAHLQEAKERYLAQRRFIDLIGHSIPFYLVIGNHEGEEGWIGDGSPDNLAVLCTRARKQVIPNPFPDGFYTGNTEWVPEQGWREDYYAWTWGDALFVVLDPFWYTKDKPHGPSDAPGTRDGWDWTLGEAQYNWLYDTLSQSDANWKFVFIHHLVSTTTEDKLFSHEYYGRGGKEVAAYFEWGGCNEDASYGFEDRRPGQAWAHGPIHDFLVAENVTIVFHGHDHLFAKQELDGVVYQECPQPIDATYSFAFHNLDDPDEPYRDGVFLPNSGHVQCTVNPNSVVVRYIRAYLPEDEGMDGNGMNGETAFVYKIPYAP